MEAPILTARILGIIYLSFGIGVLLNWDNYKRIILDMLDNTAFMVLGGFIAVGLGVTLLSVHNIWVGTWHSLITLIGWIATIKGILLLVFPSKWVIYRPLLEIGYYRWIIVLIALTVGTLFIYFGFF